MNTEETEVEKERNGWMNGCMDAWKGREEGEKEKLKYIQLMQQRNKVIGCLLDDLAKSPGSDELPGPLGLHLIG